MRANILGWILAILLILVLLSLPVGRLAPSLQLFARATDTGACNYASLIRQDAQEFNLPPDLFVRQIFRESRCNPNAIGAAGEEGIAQFMPETAREQGLVNPFDPVASLKAAARLERHYQDQFGSYDKALAAYNAGPGSVETAIAECGPSVWLPCMNRGTQDYIQAIVYG